MTAKTDLAIAFVPFLIPKAPPTGPYLIKTIAEKNGYKCVVKDLNFDLYTRPGMQEVFRDRSSDFDIFTSNPHERFGQLYKEKLQPIYVEWAKELVAYNAETIAICMFSYFSLTSSKALIDEIRRLKQQQSFLLCGPGVDAIVRNSDLREFLGKDIDYIQGEGEYTILQYLQGQRSFPGLNSRPEQIKDLDTLPIVQYPAQAFKDYDEFGIQKAAFLTASRGCVRKCTFCDIGLYWPKFRFRSAENVLEEMIHLHRDHDRNEIHFTDSLINGSVRELRELCMLLIEYKKTTDAPLTWGGQFICRSASDFQPSDYDLLKQAGCKFVSIGIESGSEEVRKHMKKNFSNEDLYYTLSQLARVRISVTALMLVGYITETDTDFEETLNFVRKAKGLGLLSTDKEGWRPIYSIFWSVMSIIPETPIWEIGHRDFELTTVRRNRLWQTPDNNRKIRLERVFKALLLIEELGVPEVIENQLAGNYNELWKEYMQLTEHCKGERIDIGNANILYRNSIDTPKVKELI